MTSWKVDVKGELDDAIERLNNPETRQMVEEIHDEYSKEYVDQIEEEQ